LWKTPFTRNRLLFSARQRISGQQQNGQARRRTEMERHPRKTDPNHSRLPQTQPGAPCPVRLGPGRRFGFCTVPQGPSALPCPGAAAGSLFLYFQGIKPKLAARSAIRQKSGKHVCNL
jgi:hypothetical protein